MERCDFSAVIAIIRNYISDDYGMDQSDVLYELFEHLQRIRGLYKFGFGNNGCGDNAEKDAVM